MKELMKSVGWTEIYSETINRLQYFCNCFRNQWSDDVISGGEIEESVINNAAIYGQNELYSLYHVAHNLVIDANQNSRDDEYLNITDVLNSFITAFDEEIPETAIMLKPRNYINLFMEYLYSVHIKHN